MMSKIEEIRKLLGEAQRKAHEIREGLLAYHIGTALRVARSEIPVP